LEKTSAANEKAPPSKQPIADGEDGMVLTFFEKHANLKVPTGACEAVGFLWKQLIRICE